MPDDVNNNGPSYFPKWPTLFKPGTASILNIVDDTEDHTIAVPPHSYIISAPTTRSKPGDAHVRLMEFASPFDKDVYAGPLDGRNGFELYLQQPLPLREKTTERLVEPVAGEQLEEDSEAWLDLPKRIVWMEKHIFAGRRAIAEERWTDVFDHYRAALKLLEERIDQKRFGSTSLYQIDDPNAKEMYYEAIFMAAAYNTEPNNAPAILSRLNDVKRNSLDEHGNIINGYYYAKAVMMRAYTQMRFAAARNIQKVGFYEQAEGNVRSILGYFREHPDDLFAAEALLVELKTRQMERANHRGDRAVRDALRDSLIDELESFTDRYEKESSVSQREAVALLESHTAQVFASMGLWEDALGRVSRVTESEIYSQTQAAQALPGQQIFDPLVEDGKFITLEEFKDRQPLLMPALKRVQAMFANAHSEGIGQTAIACALGAGLTMIGDALLHGGELTTFFWPAIVAGGVSLVNRMWHGWRTEETKNAGFGLYERSAKESALDVGRVALYSAFGTLLTLPVTKVATMLPEVYDEAEATFRRAGGLYFAFAQWLAESVNSLAYPETYKGIYEAYLSYIDKVSDHDNPFMVLGHSIRDVGYMTYLGLTAHHYFTWLFSPGRREALKKRAPWFILGGIFLGAEAGEKIAEKHQLLPELFERYVRGGLAFIEGSGTLFIAGLIALSRNRTAKEATKAMWKAFSGSDHSTLVSWALTVGISSALGGLMQKGPELHDVALIATRGMATTIGLLPIVFGVSGLLKGTITWPAGAREGWQDSKGSFIPSRLSHGAIGLGNAFWTPYVFNRFWRAFLLDLPVAGIRTWLGWDTNKGYGAQVFLNVLSTNPTATMTFPETGRTSLETDAFLRELRKYNLETIWDHWRKASQRMTLDHLIQPHRLWDALFPLTAIRGILRPPLFPLKPQTHYLANLYQLIRNGCYQEFDGGDMDILLWAVGSLVQEASRFEDDESIYEEAEHLMQMDISRGLLKAIWAARDDEKHGSRIIRFFAHEQPWMFDILGIDPEAVPEVQKLHQGRFRWGRFRWVLRRRIRKAVAKSRWRHLRDIKEYAAHKKPQHPIMKRFFHIMLEDSYGSGPIYKGQRYKGGGTPPPEDGVDEAPGTGAATRGVKRSPEPPVPAALGISAPPPSDAATKPGYWANVGAYSDKPMCPEQESAPDSAYLIQGMQVPIIQGFDPTLNSGAGIAAQPFVTVTIPQAVLQNMKASSGL